jgi:hypothetical protein
VYVAGVTSSSDFPVSSPAVQPTLLGFSDAFMLEFDPTGTVLLYSTLLGGTGEDTATGLAIDHFGAVCVVGYSSSADFPSAAPIQASFGGVYDAFVTILSPAGSGYYFSTLLGGSGIDQITGVAVDGMGDITVSGQTGSADFPLLNPVLTHFGGIDAFAMKIATNDNAMFVNRVYYGVFQSLPSAAILAQWTTELNQGVSRAQVALSLLQDPTAYAQAFSVVSEYLTILAREPDYGGFEFWARALRNGFSQADLLTTFISSPEFQLRFNASSNTAFVTLLYLNALGRPPDPDGLTFWVNYLNNGLARSLLLQIFLNSPEFQSTFGNHILVD